MSSSLPPGQIETRHFPVVGEREPTAEISDPSNWRLRVKGLVEREFEIGLNELVRTGGRSITIDIHCVTSWTRFNSSFTGLPLADLIAPTSGARFVAFTAYSRRDHHTSLPIEYALRNAWVVHTFEGEPIAVEHGDRFGWSHLASTSTSRSSG